MIIPSANYFFVKMLIKCNYNYIIVFQFRQSFSRSSSSGYLKTTFYIRAHNSSRIQLLTSHSFIFIVKLDALFQIDKVDRVIFMWKIEVTEQKEKASDMRRRNEALVYNILPMHVAEHFMGNRKRSYDELYSQSYAEVGVLFASMPNFSGTSDTLQSETNLGHKTQCLTLSFHHILP